jgi:transcriptional antiterminator
LRRLLLLVLLLLSPALLAAVETALRISDHEIIEGLADIKGDIKRLDAEIKAIRVELRTEIRGALRVLH